MRAEAFRLDWQHHQPTVADGADLVGQQIGRDIVANLALGLAFFQHCGEYLAEACVTLLDDDGEGGFVTGVGQQLQPGQPIVRFVGRGPVEPLPDERPDINLLAVGFQQGIHPVE
ncbi:hypothetical protein D3C78_1397070 [compost metagenome]